MNKRILLIAIVIAFAAPGYVVAQSASSNYRVEEAFIGAGGELDASSTNFQGKLSAAELAAGRIDSAQFGAQAGFNTTYQPYIYFEVETTSLDLGLLDAGSTANGTATMRIRNYLSSGYTISVVGTTLTNESGAVIDALTTATAAATQTEQFGLNVVANSGFGANPVQNPDGTFSFGAAATGYNTADSFRFNTGDTIALSASESGETQFTASYIANIAPLTDAGQYQATHSFVATGTY